MVPKNTEVWILFRLDSGDREIFIDNKMMDDLFVKYFNGTIGRNVEIDQKNCSPLMEFCSAATILTLPRSILLLTLILKLFRILTTEK